MAQPLHAVEWLSSENKSGFIIISGVVLVQEGGLPKNYLVHLEQDLVEAKDDDNDK